MAERSKGASKADGAGIRLAIVTAEFNRRINDAMRDAALEAALRLGAKVVVDVRAPGVFDIGVIADAVLARSDVDGLVALGAVITGETRHDEVVTLEAARTLAALAVAHKKPVGLGITGPGQTEPQARARIDRAAWAVESVCKQFRTLADLGSVRVRAP